MLRQSMYSLLRVLLTLRYKYTIDLISIIKSMECTSVIIL